MKPSAKTREAEKHGSAMKRELSGMWVSESSNISGYIAGAEWLEFLDGGKDHVWKMRQPVGELWICRFRLEERDKDWLFFPTSHEKNAGESWPIGFDLLPDDRLAVSHHGFTTVFKRPASRPKNEPIKSSTAQRP